VTAFRSRRISRENNGAIDNPANARWSSHKTGQVIVLMGRGVERRSAVRMCRSMETLVIDESGGSINGNDGWLLVRTIKQRGNLSTLSDSKFGVSFSPSSRRLCCVSHARYFNLKDTQQLESQLELGG
jgi:hypothetical protein